MGTIELLLAIIVFTLLGCIVGIITGLVPGIHVNNVAYMILASQSMIVSMAIWAFGWALPSNLELMIIVCCLVIGNVITHTFLDFIPSVFLGAPEGETALSLLPGHRMMLAGRGYEAVKCSVIGSFGAVLGALALLIPMRLIIGSPINAYDALAAWMHLLLLGISIFLIMTEIARPGDVSRKSKFEMKGHCLLGQINIEQVTHDGQEVLELSNLDAGTEEMVALKATIINKFSDAGSRFYLLKDGNNQVLLEALGQPLVEPEIDEQIIAIGSIIPILTWKDHLKKRALAAGVFLLSGLLGIALLSTPGMASRNIFLIEISSLDPSTVLLFPLFTGLFGLSTLLMSMMDSPEIPEQDLSRTKVRLSLKQQFKAIMSGTIASTASWFPGVSAAISTIISVFLHKSNDDAAEGKANETETQEFLVSVSAVNTSVALFNLMALFVILKSRSGAMKAVEGIIANNLTEWEPLGNVPMAMSSLLLAALIAALVSIPLALFFGKIFAKYCSKINYTMLVRTVIVFLLAMIILFSGVLGLVILAIATCVGMIPPLIGVKRVHLMGCLIVPVILFFI
ncbi:MAG: tripartite tricarboxylate transporter permease [Thermoplasmata archaeon]|nr:tripartite tricarboxylate transporter permease [Thermoplasmata archaeon]